MYFEKVIHITHSSHLISLIKKQYLLCDTDDSTEREAETCILQTQLSAAKKRHETYK